MDGSTPIESLTEKVIGCAIEVHRTFGPGLLEAIYRDCLVIEMRIGGLHFELERCVPLEYRGHRLNRYLRVDLIVDGRLVVEVKAVEKLHPVHLAQTITYLKMTGCAAACSSTSIRPL
jgi:GxxExxY protein